MKMSSQINYKYIATANININTEVLTTELQKLKDIKSHLDETFDNIEKNTKDLKNYWESRTSDSVQETFIEFYKKVEKTKNNLASDIAFLENVIKDHQKELDYENKIIDEKIAVG